MTTHAKWYAAFLAGLMILVCAGAPAKADEPLLQVMHAGDATYITGGVGDDELNALKAQAQNYNVLITNAEKGGAYLDGTDLVIEGKSAHEPIAIKDAGPLVYIKLPPGTYKISATNDGRKLEKQVKVGASKESHAYFIWPEQS